MGITGEEESAFFEIKFLLNELEALDRSLVEINTRIQNIVSDRHDYRLLITIHGVGPVTASSTIAEIGDITNFSSGKQLIKLSGLDLYGSESGTSIHSLRHISKRGRRTLRTVLYQAAVSCIKCNAHLKACYLKFLAHQPQKKKIKPKAIIAIVCKLLRMIYRMLTDKRPFDSTYDQRLREKASLRMAKSSVLV